MRLTVWSYIKLGSGKVKLTSTLKLNMNQLLVYFNYWYPLPSVIPDEIRVIIFDYVFNPLEDPW